MKKYKLIEVVSKGSHARHDIDPSIIIGESDNKTYLTGDVLDANATEQLVKTKIDEIVDGATEALDTLKEIDDELAKKANSADLSTVATSGSYTDLTNKPVIPNFVATANPIDMGLPSGTLWADRNVWAESETEPGLYFQWGDIEGFSKDSGRYCNGDRVDERNWTGDYSATHGCMLGDEQNIPVDPYFDAARKNIGAPWRMPTTTEFQELFNDSYTTSQWVTNYKGSGMNGLLVTSKANGNTLFFPAAGCFNEGFNSFGSYGDYWSSSYNDLDYACILYFDNSGIYPDDSNYRYCGYSVRAVQ